MSCGAPAANDLCMACEASSPAPVSTPLALILEALAVYLRTYVVMSPTQACALSLWAAHTHVFPAFEQTPFLEVTSPEKRCGKSRLFEVLAAVVARPWRVITPSEAVLFRKIERDHPTLLLDEADAIFDKSNGTTEPLRALLNASNREGTSIPRCVGPSQELKDFDIFCPKALAGIRDYAPETVRDRSIRIRLERKLASEPAQKWRREDRAAAEPLHGALVLWAPEAVAALAASRPTPADGLDDRSEESWEPLLAIADMAGDGWPERARLAAVELSGTAERAEEALGPMLLRDIAETFASSGEDRLSSASLAAALGDIETSPWGDIRGKALDSRGLARRLAPFDIRPRTVRLSDGTTAKGYPLEAFAEAFARYLDGFNRHTVTTRMDKGFAADFEPSHVTDENARKPAWTNGCDGVTDKNGEKGE